MQQAQGLCLKLAPETKADFRQLTDELKGLMPQHDERGRLQFRVLRPGEKPLNRRNRRYIARRLLAGGLDTAA